MAETQVATRAPMRSLAPDLARGGMLLLIALANVSSFLWHGEGVTPATNETLDRVLGFVMTVAVEGRAVTLFSFLLGYGMVQFCAARVATGFPEPTARRFLRRRHLALVLFGIVHAALLFAGDILGAYGLLGLVLVPLFFGRRDRTIGVWAGLLAVTLALLSGTLITLALVAPGELATMGSLDEGSDGYDRLMSTLVGDVAYLDSVWPRVRLWGVVLLQLPVSEVPLCIMFGWLAARRRLLEEPWAHVRTLTRLAVLGIGIGWFGGLPAALATLDALPVDPRVDWVFGPLAWLTGAAGGIGYAAVFGLVAARAHGAAAAGPVRRAVTAVGARSLTFYLWQSVVFAPLLCGWGLGLGADIGRSAALGLAVLVWASSLPLALLFERRGRRGPAEVALRRLSYGTRSPAESVLRPLTYGGRRATPGR